LALVKQMETDRVVLRPRAGLLPARNIRRKMVAAGSVFQIAVRVEQAERDSILPDSFLVVEDIDDRGLQCRWVSRFKNPLDERTAADWIAVGARPTRPATEFQLVRDDRGAPKPFAGCDVWSANAVDDPGQFIGRADNDGRVVVSGDGSVRWLRMMLGAVSLESRPVLPGWQARQVIGSQVNAQTLQTATALSDCRDDLLELTALRETYLARCKFREDAGRVDDAAELRKELQTLLEEQVSQLKDRFRQRRNRVAVSGSDGAQRWQREWTELMQTLELLLKDPSSDAETAESQDDGHP
jgi:hypothetical protein